MLNKSKWQIKKTKVFNKYMSPNLNVAYKELNQKVMGELLS